MFEIGMRKRAVRQILPGSFFHGKGFKERNPGGAAESICKFPGIVIYYIGICVRDKLRRINIEKEGYLSWHY